MASQELKQYMRRAVREFLVTTALLGSSFLLAILSTFLVQTNEYQLGIAAAILSLILAAGGGFYIVPKLAKRVNLRLFSLKISYSATTETAFFVILTVIVGFSAFNTGNNLLYLIFSILIAVLLASGIISDTSLRNIDVSLRFPEHIFATREAMLDLSVINRKRFIPSFSLTVGILTRDSHDVDESGFAQKIRRLLLGSQLEKGLGRLAHYAILPGNGKISQRLSYTFKKRGSYRIVGFSVSTKFPFGFLRKSQEKEALGEVIVYPQPQPIQSFNGVVPVLSGWLESSMRGNGSDLYLIRQYSSNDNMRHIDWKATAKSRQLMVKEYLKEDERRVTIVMDDFYNRELQNFELRFERGVELAASLVDHFTNQNSEVRLLTQERQTEFSVGQEHLYKMLRILALVEPHDCDHYVPEQISEFKSMDELLELDHKDLKIVITGRPMEIHSAKIRVIGLERL